MAMPKSQSFMAPECSIMMFVGLMSRCSTRFSCAKDRALATDCTR